jgi:hypothetical protein
MVGLVEEIQRGALDPDVSVSSLLLKVKVAAAKLELGNVEAWVESELNGYSTPVPEYRQLRGSPKAFNPYRGWIPIMLPTKKQNEWLSTVMITNSIATIEDIVRGSKKGLLESPFPASLIKELNRSMDIEFGQMSNHLSANQFQSIIHFVRNMVLDWSLKLEKAGVTGQGFSFNAEERKKAQENAVTYNIGSIGTFAGNLGNANTSGSITLVINSWSDLQNFADQVSKASSSLGDEGADTVMLDTAIKELKAEINKPDPDSGMVRGLLGDVRNAVSGAAGSLIASGIIAQVASFLGP